MFQTKPTMTQENTNCLRNTKKGLLSVAWDNIMLAHG